jgi:histone-arginine methyltransferase CARM1
VARAEVFGTMALLLRVVADLNKAQPVVGMFPPTSLLSAPCSPKSFDFYTCSMQDLLEFSVPIEFVVARTALLHGVSGQCVEVCKAVY